MSDNWRAFRVGYHAWGVVFTLLMVSVARGGDARFAMVGNAAVGRGALCLTFDDRNFDSWERNIPLFRKYGAHATFFVCGKIDERAEGCMRRLSKAGHSIGLHGLKHQRAVAAIENLGAEGYLREEILPQLSVCREKGLGVKSFAYPMSNRTPETDAVLLRHFARLRSGFGRAGDKTWGEAVPPFPMSDAANRCVLMGACGTYPDGMPDKIASMMPSLAASNAVLVVYAHCIERRGDKHSRHNITEEELEKVLAAAKDAGVAILGFDELPGIEDAVPLLPEIRYDFTRQRLFSGFDGRLCKVQPSIATDGQGTAILCFQKLLLTGSDVFFGQFLSKSDDGGATWSCPVEQLAIADTFENGFRVTRYGTIHYGKVSARWFALGLEALYKGNKEPLQTCVDGRPYGTPIYISVDAKKGCFTGYTKMPFPFAYEQAFPFGQILEYENGDILVSFYYRPVGMQMRSRCVTVRYAFDSAGLKVVTVGVPIACDNLNRGIGEPSLARLGGKVYMTLRSDEAGMWCESGDGGLTFSEPRPWTWTDGARIGNRNTQQHWITCGESLFLAYTREDRNNSHVFRNRAPIFMARFDPVCGGLVRGTEFPLVPELGARLGNFCVDSTGDESWLVTAEWMQPVGCERYGADNSIWLVKVKKK